MFINSKVHHMPYVYLFSAIIFEVAGIVTLKLSDGFTKPLYATVTILGWGVALYLLSISLKYFNIGFTYAIWASLGIVLVALIGVVFLGEKADWQGLLGLALILSGVVVLYKFSKMSGH